MATKHALVILAPNGRRHTVNVTQNTSIQEVLEIVCKKQDLDFNEWDLKHYNRIIELANSVRFSGLPNNASLEMVQSTKPRKETSITLVLQLESGKRLKQEFSSSANMWDVLTHWQSNGEDVWQAASGSVAPIEDGIEPVCIYMRQEIIGEEQLKKTTLRSLGLTHGAACIRLIHRSRGQLKHQANISAPISRPTTSDFNIEEIYVNDKNNSQPHNMPQQPPVENVKRKATSPSPSPQSNQPQPEVESMEVGETPSAAEASGNASRRQNTAESSNSRSASREPEYIPPQNKLAVDGQLNLLGDHDACFYYSGDVSRLNLQADYDDSFYEITKQDVQRRQRDLRQMREALENSPLRTAEAREAQRLELQGRILSEHPWTIIRVRFPNRYILQGVFRSDDTIESVKAFVRKYLADPNLNFYLLITPPRTILSEETRLIDQNLIGSAVVYFGCDQAGETVDFLKADMYEKLSCPNAIREHFQRMIQPVVAAGSSNAPSQPEQEQPAATSRIPPQSSSNQAGTSHQAPSSSTAPPPARPAARPAQNSGVVPKWFKK